MKRASLFVLSLVMVIAFCLAPIAASAQSIPNWAPNTAYAVGAQVLFNGQQFKCIQAHTSQVGWEPPNVPALWQLVSGTPSPTPTPTPPPNPTPTPTPKPTPTPTPTPTPGGGGGGNCFAPWIASQVYTVGLTASLSGINYTANFWTQNQSPVTNNGGPGSGQPWTSNGPCSGGPGPTPTPTSTPNPTPTPKPSPTPTPNPTPTPTPNPTPTPGPTPQGGLPKHLLTGYWQDFNNGAKCLRISDVPTTFDIIAVAFANSTATAGAVDFTIDSGLSACISGGYTEAQFISDISAAHGRGQRVIISVGGANGAISVSDSTASSNFANSVAALMTKFGFDGVDIDLENGLNPTAMAAALKQLSSMKPGVIITLAPQTVDMQSTSGSYFQLALNIQNILTIVNMQYYNSGTMLGCDGGVYAEATENFETALACIQLQNGLRPDQVGLGLPAQANAAGGGVVDPSVVVASLNCLARGANCGTFVPSLMWPGIRGAMTWSINWDASNGFHFANTLRSGLNSLP